MVQVAMAKEDIRELAKAWGVSEEEARKKLMGTVKKTLTPEILDAIRSRRGTNSDG